MLEKGITFTVFAVVDYIGDWNKWEVNLGGRKFKHMNWEQLKQMKSVEIGSHTMSHRSLPLLSGAELKYELETSRKILQDKLGASVDYLSLPFGRYSPEVIACAKEAGYKAVCTMNPEPGVDPFVIGRYGVYYIDNLTTIRGKLGRGWLNKAEILKLKLMNRFSGGTIIVKKWRKKRI